MKKIKLFSLVAAALFAGSTMAQTTTIFDASDADWTATGVNLTTGATTVGEVTWYGRSSAAISSNTLKFSDDVSWTAYLKFGGGSTFKSGSDLAGVFTYTPAVAGTLKVYTKGGGDSARKLYVSQSISSTNKDTETAIATADGTSKAANIAVATVAAGEMVYIWGDNNMYVYGITFEASAPVSDPWIAFSKEEVSLKVTPFVATAEAELTLKGGNLTAGTYDLTLPTVTGLTITPTSVTVAEDGALNETITLSYTSDVNVEAASAVLALTISELTASTTINYSANVDVLTQTVVTEDITWNWANAGTADVVFTETSKPSKTDTIVLANVDGIANDANFNSQALSVRGEYMFRKEFNCFQGDYISFNVEKAGTVQVVFSNTNKRDANKGLGRVLHINGVPTNDSTLNVTEVTSQPIAIPAGKVTITSKMPSQPDAYQYLRIYSIIYTMDKSGDIGSSLNQAQVEAKAVKVIRDGQLLIIRDGKTYTAQGVELR